MYAYTMQPNNAWHTQDIHKWEKQKKNRSSYKMCIYYKRNLSTYRNYVTLNSSCTCYFVLLRLICVYFTNYCIVLYLLLLRFTNPAVMLPYKINYCLIDWLNSFSCLETTRLSNTTTTTWPGPRLYKSHIYLSHFCCYTPTWSKYRQILQ